MSIERVSQRYSRLKQDLACAYEARPWHSGRIDRIADQVVATERELMSLFASDARPGRVQSPSWVALNAERAGQGQNAGPR